MAMPIRIPKLSHIRSRLARRAEPNAAAYSVLTRLAELYDLGEIVDCYRARRSHSLNFIVTTSRGKHVFRRHLLSEETVAHEHQVLCHLEQRRFPAPRMRLDREGQAWVTIDGSIYSVYEFVSGQCFTDFIWWPASRLEIVRQAGRTLAEYHQATADLVPTRFKWDAYHPTGHKRWREGALYRQALAEIRSLLLKPAATSPVDDFARSHLDGIEELLDRESIVEQDPNLTRVVIHGDYAPWNLLLRPDRSLFVLDFNAARLDLRVFDVILATFWFAWRNGSLDRARAMAFQTGYCQAGSLDKAELEQASNVFQWVMGRSIAERLRTHYLEGRFVIQDPAALERFYDMCAWAAQQPERLTRGLHAVPMTRRARPHSKERR
jgi:Ser/Thr protein kinase RdoA (MazF antagonist)